MTLKAFWIKFLDRNERLILTLVSKQWLGFFIATGLLVAGCITPEVWVVAFGAVVVSNVVQKQLGLVGAPPEQKPPGD